MEDVSNYHQHTNYLHWLRKYIFTFRTVTPEGLHYFLAASTYSRIRIAQQLLPLLITASKTTPLARVIDVAGGTKEGDIDLSDLQALKLSLPRLRPHLTSMHTLAWETLVQQAPTVSFVHDFPGSVYTELHKGGSRWFERTLGVVFEIFYFLLGRWLFVPIEECGERHVFLATSGRYKPKEGQAVGVALVDGIEDGIGSDGEVGSGVYSVDWDGEGPGETAEHALKGLRKKGVREIVWDHYEAQFEKAVKSAAS